MSDVTDAAEVIAAEEPAAPTQAEAQTLAESGQAEGTTPEEVATVLKNSGINVPAEPVASDEEAEAAKAKEAEDAKAAADKEEADKVAADEATAAEDAKAAKAKPEAEKTEEAETAKEFTLEVEDASGETHKIEKIEDLPEDFEPKNNRQIMQILKDLSTLEGDKAKYEADQAEEAKQAETATTVENTLKGWEEERKELDITDDKRYGEVMKYMSTENDKRQEAGKPMIQTVEHALLGLEKQEAKAAAEDKVKADKETARKNGGLVGGSSAPASSGTPAYKAGSARNANEAIRAMGLI
jgi:hypothetical protein